MRRISFPLWPEKLQSFISTSLSSHPYRRTLCSKYIRSGMTSKSLLTTVAAVSVQRHKDGTRLAQMSELCHCRPIVIRSAGASAPFLRTAARHSRCWWLYLSTKAQVGNFLLPYFVLHLVFRALKLLVGRHEERMACKKLE